MRERIRLVVAATTSAVIVAFVVPLCMLVATLAADRAVSAAQVRAQNVAVILASSPNRAALDAHLRQLPMDGPTTTVLLPTGEVLGPNSPPVATDPLVTRSLAQRSAFTERGPDSAAALVPVQLASGVAVVRSSVTRDQLRHGVATAWATIIGLGVLLFALSLTLASLLGRRIAVPVTDLASVAHELRGGALDARAAVSGPREVQELGKALNQLAERIVELLAAEREVAADLGHRLRTPVTALRLDSELVDDPELAARLAGHVDQLQRTVDAVVAEARRPVRAPMRATCDLVAVVADRVRFWTPLAEDQDRAVAVELPERAVRVGLGAEDVRDVVDNLLDNVFAHTPDGTPIAVRVEHGDATSALIVEDGGPGLADAASSTRRGTSGAGSTGLGLDIVRRLARSADGSIHLDEGRLGGLRVRVEMGQSPDS